VLKRFFSGYPPAGLTVLINASAIAWFLPVTVATTDLAVDGTGSSPGGGRRGPPAAVAVVAGTATATAAAFVLFLRAIEDGDVSYVTPINKVVPMFVLPMEVLLLGEVLAPVQVGGVVVATAAVYVANYEPGGTCPAPIASGPLTAGPARVSERGVLRGRRPREAGGLQELAIPGTLGVPLLLAGAGLVLLPSAIRNPPSVTRRDAPKFLAGGALVALGEHLTHGRVRGAARERRPR